MPPSNTVSIRLLGPARAVAQVAHRLRVALAVIEESGDRPSRYSAGVRRYLTAPAAGHALAPLSQRCPHRPHRAFPRPALARVGRSGRVGEGSEVVADGGVLVGGK